MKKKMIYVVATLMLVAVSVVNVKTVLDANRSYDLTMTSIDALSENGDGEGGGGDGSGENDGGGGNNGESDTGANITDAKKCHDKNGYWDMALQCTDSGFVKETCTTSGQLTVWGITIFNYSYSKGKEYEVAWERWACISSTGNCCLSDKQGLRIK